MTDDSAVEDTATNDTAADSELLEDEPPQGAGFAELGLRAELLRALDDLGYEEPTPIQREAIPAMLGGRDLLGQAATGTG
ncbi:MAG: box helicase domain protein, partial [Ilumatobacteraceae bacterium]|nr:box helicase domain protein [Ilumatobacteraceae bacterium]